MPATIECGPGSDELFEANVNLQILGPLLAVQVGFDLKFDGLRRPNLPDDDICAMLDTGSELSYLDVRLVERLGLLKVDEWEVAGLAGRRIIDVHHAHLYVPDAKKVVSGKFGVGEIRAGRSQHEVILGRRFLGGFVMRYDGLSGSVQLQS